jgi:hypothetical protein
VFSDDLFPSLRTFREYRSDAFSELSDELFVEFSSAFACSFIASLPDLAICQTLRLGPPERVFLH